MQRNSRIAAAIAMGAVCIGAQAAEQAANYPSRPIRFIVGFPPGGTNDIIARLLAHKLSENIGQTVIVDNRAGANTAIASEYFVRSAPPDGYTIMQVAPGHATNPAMLKLNFDPIKDFQFITVAAQSQNLLVLHPSFPPKSVKELIAISKQRPGDINYGSSGIGSALPLTPR